MPRFFTGLELKVAICDVHSGFVVICHGGESFHVGQAFDAAVVFS